MIKDLAQNVVMRDSQLPYPIAFKVITDQANSKSFAETLCLSQGGRFVSLKSEVISKSIANSIDQIVTSGTISTFGINTLVPVYTSDLKMNSIRGDRFFYYGDERYSVISQVQCKFIERSLTPEVQATLKINHQ